MARYGRNYERGRYWMGGAVGGGGRGPRPRGYGSGYGYGYGFRRGYDVMGGFGYANEQARGQGERFYDASYRSGRARRTPARPGEMHVSRWHGRGYGRG